MVQVNPQSGLVSSKLQTKTLNVRLMKGSGDVELGSSISTGNAAASRPRPGNAAATVKR